MPFLYLFSRPEPWLPPVQYSVYLEVSNVNALENIGMTRCSTFVELDSFPIKPAMQNEETRTFSEFPG